MAADPKKRHKAKIDLGCLLPTNIIVQKRFRLCPVFPLNLPAADIGGGTMWHSEGACFNETAAIVMQPGTSRISALP